MGKKIIIIQLKNSAILKFQKILKYLMLKMYIFIFHIFFLIPFSDNWTSSVEDKEKKKDLSSAPV